MSEILILNGPNLNLLGMREPDIYGTETLSDIKKLCTEEAEKLSINIDFRQSNAEQELISWIQEAKEFDGIIINAAGYTHTSIAIMDALLAVSKPTIEVHLSNVYRREEFRHASYVSPAASGIICGFGGQGYILALQAIRNLV